MRKHFSVLMLIARSTIYKILGIFIIMGAVEVLLFYYTLSAYPADRSFSQRTTGLESLFAGSRISWVFAIAFMAVTILLCLTGCEFKSKPGYTLRRLMISERSIYLWQALYSTCCYLFLWAMQLIITLALCKLYTANANASSLSNQTVFLAYYRNSFLHSLLPLDETSRYIRNAALIIGLGTTSACFPFRQRRGKICAGLIILVSMIFVFFDRNMGAFGNDIFLILVSVTTAAESLFFALRKEACHEA